MIIYNFFFRLWYFFICLPISISLFRHEIFSFKQKHSLKVKYTIFLFKMLIGQFSLYNVLILYNKYYIKKKKKFLMDLYEFWWNPIVFFLFDQLNLDFYKKNVIYIGFILEYAKVKHIFFPLKNTNCKSIVLFYKMHQKLKKSVDYRVNLIHSVFQNVSINWKGKNENSRNFLL